jgi:hypothetical protein
MNSVDPTAQLKFLLTKYTNSYDNVLLKGYFLFTTYGVVSPNS